MIKPKRFIGLHAHDGFSSFDGLGLPKEHFDFVIENTKDELEIPALAITNHGHMNSYMHAYLAAKELAKAGRGFKFLPGVELYVHPDLAEWRQLKAEKDLHHDAKEDQEHGGTVENEDESKTAKFYDPIKRRHHLVVLAKHSKGLEHLFATVSSGYLEGFYKFPRVDYSMLKKFKGDFIASTACLHPDSELLTNHGLITIKEVVEKLLEGLELLVLSYDEDLREVKFMPVTWGDVTRKNADLIQIELEDGSLLKLTLDHKVFTKRGWIEAQYLMNDDEILSIQP